jgi:glycosyltransferase involved in cell wall biosynthesis
MKIAYINRMYGRLSGVNAKVMSQARAAKELGLNMDLIVLNLERDAREDNLRYINIAGEKSGLLNRLERKLFRYRIIEKAVSLQYYDRLVLRWPGADLSSSSFASRYGLKTVTEHHTDELGEALARASKLTGKIKYHFEASRMPYFLSKVAGIIAVTDEILKRQIEKSGTKPSAVISNGIDVEATPFTRFMPFNGKILNILFLSSDLDQPWNGIDRMIKGLASYKGSTRINFYLIGSGGECYSEMIGLINNENVKVIITKEKSGPDLDAYFEQCNIGISSLAVFRKKMTQACSLKTREYIARGMPFIYAYQDVDLAGREEFAMRIDEEERPLDIERIIEFSSNVSKIKNVSDEMRLFAEKKLDWKIKLQMMHDFVISC